MVRKRIDNFSFIVFNVFKRNFSSDFKIFMYKIVLWSPQNKPSPYTKIHIKYFVYRIIFPFFLGEKLLNKIK